MSARIAEPGSTVVTNGCRCAGSARFLGLARSGAYRSAPLREDDAAAMRQIDSLYTDHPFYGSRRIAFELKMSSKRVQRLMRLMGIAALGPKPRTSKPAPGHKVFPYLLRGVPVERPNQVWACDITYAPIGAGFFYLVATMDWASRAVLSWGPPHAQAVAFHR